MKQIPLLNYNSFTSGDSSNHYVFFKFCRNAFMDFICRMFSHVSCGHGLAKNVY